MFKVFIVEDVINLTVSEYFNNDDTLFRKLSNKYINKVIHGIGLVLAIDEKFLRCECKILQTEGSAHYKINFKVLVFHPSVNDIFNASVILINKNFIKLSIGFFDDIQVIPKFLPPNYKYDDEREEWVVTNSSGNYSLKENDVVLFKILDVIYNKNKVEDPKLDSNNTNLPVLVIIGTIVEEIATH